MLRSMYAGISGLRGFQTKLDVIGNNIANVNTTGFKKSRISFQDIMSQTISGGNKSGDTMGGTNPSQVGLGSSIGGITVMHGQGNLQSTGYSTDLAIEGNGFFMVATDKGKTDEDFYLTRAGNFGIDDDGYLVTLDGKFVLDDKGAAIQVSDDMTKVKSVTVGKDGTVTVTTDAGVTTPHKVGIASVKNPSGLEKAGGNLYKVTSAANGDDTGLDAVYGASGVGGRGIIRAGALEMSNVDMAEEFTEMIVAQRGFQANSRIITTSDSILEELVNLKR